MAFVIKLTCRKWARPRWVVLDKANRIKSYRVDRHEATRFATRAEAYPIVVRIYGFGPREISICAA